MNKILWMVPAIVFSFAMLACSDGNVTGSTEDPNVITAEKTQSSSFDSEHSSSLLEEISSSSSVVRVSSSSERIALCKASGGWGYNGCIVTSAWGQGDLWSKGNTKVKTDAYVEDPSKFGDRAGEFFFEKDSADENQIDLYWRTAASEFTGTLDGVFLYDTNYNSFFNIGFYTAGFDSNGAALSVDISNWNGICILYHGSIAPMIQLVPRADSFLNQITLQEFGFTLPLPSVKLESKDEPQCFEWIDFLTPEIEDLTSEYFIDLGDGSVFAMDVEKVVFRFRIWPREAGEEDFTILAIGSNRDE